MGSTQTNFNMKTAVVLSVCLFSTISADISCDDCLPLIGSMSSHLQSVESLAEQTATLMATLCPDSPEPESCFRDLEIYWSQIGLAMYPEFLEAATMCSEVGACLEGRAALTCAECSDAVTAVSDSLKSESKLADIVEFLKGDFCASTGSVTCGASVAKLMPLAMPVLAEVLSDNAA